jgi:hypothetical protein
MLSSAEGVRTHTFTLLEGRQTPLEKLMQFSARYRIMKKSAFILGKRWKKTPTFFSIYVDSMQK